MGLGNIIDIDVPQLFFMENIRMDNNQPQVMKVSRAVVNGIMYDITSLEDYDPSTAYVNTVITTTYQNKQLALPVKSSGYNPNATAPGVYMDGDLAFFVYPNKDNISNYTPKKMITVSNQDSLVELLEKEETIAHLAEPWITAPDNITRLPISDNDNPEMVALKKAINAKEVDFDKYAIRFGQNFPNDKRQLKSNKATLNIIKRFCDKMDMEAVLILRDKNSNVPNPMNTEIQVSLTDGNNNDECEE